MDISNHLKMVQRIPKNLCYDVIAEIIKEGFLIRIRKGRYKLKDDILSYIEEGKKEVKIIKNRVFTS